MKVGATKAALEVYLRIAMWEEVIKCYKQLGRTESVSVRPFWFKPVADPRGGVQGSAPPFWTSQDIVCNNYTICFQ